MAFVAGSSVCKQVTTAFIKHPSLLYYSFVIFVVGFLTAFHWSFFYWFIEEVAGQDTLLMGEFSRFLLTNKFTHAFCPLDSFALFFGQFIQVSATSSSLFLAKCHSSFFPSGSSRQSDLTTQLASLWRPSPCVTCVS